jgi:NitT/TauT family transport system permease protein
MRRLAFEAPAARDVVATSVESHAGPRGWSRAVRGFTRVRVSTLLIYIASICVALGLWQFLSKRSHLPALFPPATVTFERFWTMLSNGILLHASGASLARIAVGFGVGSVAGAALGLVMGSSATARALLEPYVQFFRFIPPLAWFAPVLLWFGTGESAKVTLIVYTTIFVVTLNTMAGVAAVPRNKIRMAQSFGATPRQLFVLITLPASAPYTFTGMRIAMGNSFMTVVAAEMLAANQGLGVLVNDGLLFLQITSVFAAIIALGVLGFAMDRLFQFLIQRFAGRFSVSTGAFR